MVHPAISQPTVTANDLYRLANADKTTHWIHSDLSVSESSSIGRFFWSLLSTIPLIGKSIRNAIFNTDLEKANRILVQLKPQIQSTDNIRLKNLYTSAVVKFKEIAPNHQIGLEDVVSNTPSKHKRTTSTLPTQEEIALSSFLEDGKKSIKGSSLKEYLKTKYDLQEDAIRDAVKSFNLSIGSIVDAEGVIQDPAGSAIGSVFSPAMSGAGGLSGAIYKKFSELKKIPKIASGDSIFNTGNGNAKRIMHTHSPLLSKAQNIHEAIDLIKKAYCNAIHTFLDDEHHGQTTLNLCAISAAIYGRPYTSPFGQSDHLDPSITIVALTAAIAEIKNERSEDLEDKTINLFFRGNGSLGTAQSLLTLKAEHIYDSIQE